MFESLKNIADGAGKTVLAAHELDRGEFVISFTDSTYLHLGIEDSYGDSMEVTCNPLPEYRYFSGDGIAAGLCTPADIDAYHAREAEAKRQRDATQLERQEAKELMVYRQLKQKFEGQPAKEG